MASRVTQSAFPLIKWRQRAIDSIKAYERKEPKPFREIAPKHKRAIVIPWLSTGEKWEELRYTLRSIEKFWEDKECPIYIIGDAPPKWFKEGGRLKFIHIKEYEQSNKEGLWEAWQQGMQIADEVAWWNDDIYLLKPTGWDNLRVALTEGVLDDEEVGLRASSNPWHVALGETVAEMKRQGKKEILRFATHTPYLFEREKSLEIFRTYYLHYKGSWVNLYHNHHQTPNEPCKPHKAGKLPATEGQRFYNHKNSGPDDNSRQILEKMFPEAAPFELCH